MAMTRTQSFARGSLLIAAASLAACASLPQGHEPHPQDRFERYNRAVYQFNDGLDRAIAKPVAKAYVKVTPAPVRTSVGNFFENLSYTTTIASDVLQLKFKPLATDSLRLVVNTTVGVGGLFDPATKMGIPVGDEDLGQTLGYWGVPAGPYVMLPVFGPSTVRDAAGTVVDQLYTDPLQYVSSPYAKYGLTALGMLHNRSELLSLENTLDNAYDPYVIIRSAYLQRREYQVKDGKVPDEGVEIVEDAS
jgi:phospholipid-binding lipoprotein MlaA